MTNYDKKVVDACLIVARQIDLYNAEANTLKKQSSELLNKISKSDDLHNTQKLLNDLTQLTALLQNVEERVNKINAQIKQLKSFNK